MAQYLIKFSEFINENTQIFGFKKVSDKEVKNYRNLIKLLGENDIDFLLEPIPPVQYNEDSFDFIKLTTKELRMLIDIFDLDEDFDTYGIFPDIINDAYESSLIDDNELDSDNYDDKFDEDDSLF